VPRTGNEADFQCLRLDDHARDMVSDQITVGKSSRGLRCIAGARSVARAMLWRAWSRTSKPAWRDLWRAKIVALAFASLAPVLLVTAIATFPGELLEDNLPSLQFIPWKDEKDQPWRLASQFIGEAPALNFISSSHAAPNVTYLSH
jgi:hypothetical protein